VVKRLKTMAIVSEFFPPYVTGGAEVFVERLAKYLEKRGFRIIVITTEQGQNSRKAGFKTYKIESSPFHIGHRYQFHGVTLLWMFANKGLKNKLKEIYKKEGVDIIYANNLVHLSFAPLQVAEEIGVPVVLDIHDYWPICFTKDRFFNDDICTGESPLKCAYCVARKSGSAALAPALIPGLIVEKWKRYKILRSKNIKRIVCHSPAGMKELRKHGLSSVAIPYIYMGPKGGKKTRTKKDKVFRILFVGRVEKIKGAHLLVDTAKKLMGKLNFRIDVIGRGSLMDKVDRPDLNIFVHGFMKDERFEYFKRADCLLALHGSPVPFGIVVLEGMAYQLPVIALEGTGPAEQVRGDFIGFVCKKDKIADAILRLNKDKKLAAKFRANCRKKIKKYSKEKVFCAYESVFNSVLKSI
jgi:glycosyltransferase involved in cell wall biosynthesis